MFGKNSRDMFKLAFASNCVYSATVRNTCNVSQKRKKRKIKHRNFFIPRNWDEFHRAGGRELQMHHRVFFPQILLDRRGKNSRGKTKRR